MTKAETIELLREDRNRTALKLEVLCIGIGRKLVEGSRFAEDITPIMELANTLLGELYT